MIVWNPGESLEEIERKVITKAFDFYNKNDFVAASSLKISKEELNKKLKKYEQDDLIALEKSDQKKKSFEEFNLKARGITPNLQSLENTVNKPTFDLKNQNFKTPTLKKAELRLDAK